MTLTQKIAMWSAVALGGFIIFRPGNADAAARPNLPLPLLAHTPGRLQSTGTEYPLTNLPQTWTTAQMCAWVIYMKGLLAGSGVTGRAAQLFIAHLGRETGFGRAVYGNNFGNVKAYHSDPWMRYHDGLAYKVYDSPRAGINAMIATLRDSARYGHAWSMLLAGNSAWYSALGIAGYYQFRMPDGSIVDTTAANVGPSQASYDRSLASVMRCWA